MFTSYDGGDFCSGLVLGSHGASLLTNIAKTIMTFQKMQADQVANKVPNNKAAPQKPNFRKNN